MVLALKMVSEIQHCCAACSTIWVHYHYLILGVPNAERKLNLTICIYIRKYGTFTHDLIIYVKKNLLSIRIKGVDGTARYERNFKIQTYSTYKHLK